MESLQQLASRVQLDERERRLVDRVLSALRTRTPAERAVQLRVRNCAEKYREMANRKRLGGALAQEPQLAERHELFQRLQARLESQSADES